MAVTIGYAPPVDQPSIYINRSKGEFKAQFNVFYLKDGDYIVAYAPNFEMSGYGLTDEDASRMLKESLSGYSQMLLTLKEDELLAELAKTGWRQKSFAKKRYENAAHIDKDGVLRNLDLPADTPIREHSLSLA